MDCGVADGDGSGLRDDDVAMIERVAGMEIGVSDDGWRKRKRLMLRG